MIFCKNESMAYARPVDIFLPFVVVPLIAMILLY